MRRWRDLAASGSRLCCRPRRERFPSRLRCGLWNTIVVTTRRLRAGIRPIPVSTMILCTHYSTSFFLHSFLPFETIWAFRGATRNLDTILIVAHRCTGAAPSCGDEGRKILIPNIEFVIVQNPAVLDSDHPRRQKLDECRTRQWRSCRINKWPFLDSVVVW